MFSFVHEHRLQEYLKSAPIKRFLRLQIVIKPINKKINIINSLLRWRVILLMFIQTLDHRSQIWRLSKVRTGRPHCWFLEIFWTVSLALSPRLNVLNIDWVKFVLKNCEILHSAFLRLVYTAPDLLARFCKVNLSNAKKIGLICFPGLNYCDQEPALGCDRRWLLFFGVYTE